MKHLGDYDANGSPAVVVYGKFTTFRPSTGAPYTLAGSPAVKVYKDASTTESSAGVTLTNDFDSLTGLNHVSVDTSADGSFYANGSHFELVITSGTVDGVSVVGAVVASFDLRKNSSLKPATAGRTLNIDSSNRAAIQTNVKQNTAISGFSFLMVDSLGQPKPGLTPITAQYQIDGNAFVTMTNSGGGISEIGSGWYEINIVAAETNGRQVNLKFTASGANDRDLSFFTTP